MVPSSNTAAARLGRPPRAGTGPSITGSAVVVGVRRRAVIVVLRHDDAAGEADGGDGQGRGADEASGEAAFAVGGHGNLLLTERYWARLSKRNRAVSLQVGKARSRGRYIDVKPRSRANRLLRPRAEAANCP